MGVAVRLVAYHRVRNIYTPGASKPYEISRSKIEDYVRCPRCFYFDRRLAVSKPSTPPFLLNSAVDTLLKKEFDAHRIAGTRHPIMEHYAVDAVPFGHTNLGKWRENFHGVRYHHVPTNFVVFGAVDDIWINSAEELIVVDYKATSKNAEITLEDRWKQSYKRQMEIYQWLLRQNGFNVSQTGYFVYANGQNDKPKFDAKLEFHLTLLPYKGDDSWVEPKVTEIHRALNANEFPASSPDCEYCQYIDASRKAELRP